MWALNKNEVKNICDYLSYLGGTIFSLGLCTICTRLCGAMGIYFAMIGK